MGGLDIIKYLPKTFSCNFFFCLTNQSFVMYKIQFSQLGYVAVKPFI